MKKLLIQLALLVVLPLFAGEVILGVNGRTKHQIVIPDRFENKVAEESVMRAAKLMRKVFEANQILMDIVNESSSDPTKKQIYLGTTLFAKKHGVDSSRFKHWESIWKNVDNNLIISGNDRPCTTGRLKPPYQATLFSVCEFLYRYAGARFLKPGPEGLGIVPKSLIYFKTPLNEMVKPFLVEHTGRYFDKNDLYGIANHVMPMQTVYAYWGHTHNYAFQNKGYAKNHPEYYALTNGTRKTDGVHYCFSNPQVREIIYKYMLECCEKGDVIQLGQSDGFVPCECEKCRNLYGFLPNTSPSDGIRWLKDLCWGNKIWKMHLNMLKRLKKERPEKKVMVLVYTNTQMPPIDIVKELPDNTIPLMCMFGNEEKIMAEWEKMNVPGGYATYTYYAYGLPGMTPMRNINYFANLWKLYKKYDIRYIDENVATWSWGLRGPMEYVQVRMGVDPYFKTPDELYHEYLEAAFIEAETPMTRFFNTLNKCTELWSINKSYLYKNNRDVMRTFQIMYTPEIIAQMEKDLAAAENMVRNKAAKNRINTVRGEFDYLKNIVNVVYAYQEYKRVDTIAAFNALLDALEARKKQVEKLLAAYGTSYNPVTATKNKKLFMENNGYLAIPPFNWNIAEMRKNGPFNTPEKSLIIHKVLTEISLDSSEWKSAARQKLSLTRDNNGKLQADTDFRILYDNDNLYIKVTAELKNDLMKKIKPRGQDAEIWLQESIILNISPKADKSQYYYLTFEPVLNSFADAEHGFITDTADPRYGWNDWNWTCNWKYKTTYDAKSEKWISMAVIPFKSLRTVSPKKGTIWNFNIGRIHYFDLSKGIKGRQLQVWTGKLNPSRVVGDASMGELIFE